ncbi:MAG: hypothetical protein JSW61_00690 [Candidatus Thorarchaeota archaeon]|nr:MAG: hypothetical protein JSW61_00690 [Candidatus Thorarchaeota archaeon]
MPEIRIQLPKENYSPGESVEGYVVVSSDDYFECNAIHLTLKGVESSKVVVSHGKYSTVYAEQNDFLDERVEFPVASGVQAGDTRHEFSFDLPKDVPNSYKGMHGVIEYYLVAQIERTMRRDPKEKIQLVVKGSSGESVTSEQHSDGLEDDGVLVLRGSVDDDVINRGDDFTLSFMLSGDPNIRGVRAEIISKEHVSPKGQERDWPVVLIKSQMPKEEIPIDTWVNVTLQTEADWPSPFRTSLIHYRYFLRLTLDVPWRFDKHLEIPLKIMPNVGIHDDLGGSGFTF